MKQKCQIEFLENMAKFYSGIIFLYQYKLFKSYFVFSLVSFVFYLFVIRFLCFLLSFLSFFFDFLFVPMLVFVLGGEILKKLVCIVYFNYSRRTYCGWRPCPPGSAKFSFAILRGNASCLELTQHHIKGNVSRKTKTYG